LTEQNELLDDLDVNVDKTNKDLKKATNRMQKLINGSSNCCLGFTILIEIAGMVLIILYV
jgi:hypothetical protein